MKFISKIINWFRNNINWILLGLDIAKVLSKRLDPNEKYKIDNQIIDIADKLVKKVENK